MARSLTLRAHLRAFLLLAALAVALVGRVSAGYCSHESHGREGHEHHQPVLDGGGSLGGVESKAGGGGEHAHAGGAEAFHSHGGSLRGHAVPGLFLLSWGAWWLICMNFYRAVDVASSKRAKHRSALMSKVHIQAGSSASAPWMENPFARHDSRMRLLEPLCKVVLPSIGILLELYLHPGDVCFRHLTIDDHFDPSTVNVWVHSGLYFAFLCSGLADLCVHSRFLPQGFDKVVHVMAFTHMALSFAMHLKGTELEILMHKLYVGLVVAYVAVACADFVAKTKDFCITFLRPFLMIWAGCWMTHTGVVVFSKDELGVHTWFIEMDATVMVMPLLFSFMGFSVFVASSLLFCIEMRLILGPTWKVFNDKPTGHDFLSPEDA